jgi:hypothetical protein
MTGLLLIFAAGIWLVLALIIAMFILSKIPTKTWRGGIAIPLFLLLLPMPVLDEIIGGRQFEQLCKDNSTIQVDELKATGKAVYLADLPSVQINDKWVPISLQRWQFLDVTTGETVVSYNTLKATGGVFIRALGISEGHVPLTFKSFCEPGGVVDPLKLFKELKVIQVQRSALNLEEKK